MSVQAVCLGTLDAMVNEVAAFDPRTINIKPNVCKYLVMPVGDAQFDTEWCGSRKDAWAIAREWAKGLGEGVEIRWID